MSDWNEERSIYKAKKIGQIEPRAVGGGRKRKVKKEWKVIGPSPFVGRPDYVWHSAISHELCEQWVEKQKRGWYFGRHWPEHLTQEAHDRAKERAKRYRIVGPDDGEKK